MQKSSIDDGEDHLKDKRGLEPLWMLHTGIAAAEEGSPEKLWFARRLEYRAGIE